uniref:Uncharacterized protein n=1 Tax=Ditylenchus dipsaci TaxID=166011 RepID=A0A915EVL8_9BILA
MERVELVHTKKIGARTAPITYTDDGSGCYVWTKTGRTMEKDGFDQGYFNCSGCKAVNLANAVKVQVSSLKFNLTSSTWIHDPDQYNHICEPKATTTVTGTDLRRSFQAERAAGGGGQETSAAVRVRMDQRIVREHGNKTAQEQQEIRDAACGNVTATDAGLYRAKRKRFPNISTFNEFMAAENHRMRLTLRGLEATIGQIHFAEQLLLYGDSVYCLAID